MQRKRILFVNPHIEDFAAYDHFAKPLGLLWLASYVREWFDVDFINALDRENPREKPVSFKEDGTGNFKGGLSPNQKNLLIFLETINVMDFPTQCF